jgi:hypothetical protein
MSGYHATLVPTTPLIWRASFTRFAARSTAVISARFRCGEVQRSAPEHRRRRRRPARTRRGGWRDGYCGRRTGDALRHQVLAEAHVTPSASPSAPAWRSLMNTSGGPPHADGSEQPRLARGSSRLVRVSSGMALLRSQAACSASPPRRAGLAVRVEPERKLRRLKTLHNGRVRRAGRPHSLVTQRSHERCRTA